MRTCEVADFSHEQSTTLDNSRMWCHHVRMDLAAGVGGGSGDGGPGWRRPPDEWTVFVARAFDGTRWVRIGPARREAGLACLAAVAHLGPVAAGVPREELQARAVSAAQLLEDCTAGVVMIGAGHRVERIDL